MNASSLLMVIRSRTFGMLCSATFSEVSSAAAITGSAEFFAPLIATVPCSTFPPLIKNLSIPPPASSPLASRRRKSQNRVFLLLLRTENPTTHSPSAHRKSPFATPSFLFASAVPIPSFNITSATRISCPTTRNACPARLRQNPQRAIRQLLIRQQHVNHQVLIYMS